MKKVHAFLGLGVISVALFGLFDAPITLAHRYTGLDSQGHTLATPEDPCPNQYTYDIEPDQELFCWGKNPYNVKPNSMNILQERQEYFRQVIIPAVPKD
jgi:hypothetical protein